MHAGANLVRPGCFATLFRASQELICFEKENRVDMHRYGWDMFFCVPES
jgi:hypothetical protein